MVFLAQTAPDAFPGIITLVNLGVLGITFILFVRGNIHPDSVVKDMRAQLDQANARANLESADAKAVRDVVIKDVVPVMALMGERSKDMADLAERLLVIVTKQEGK